MTIQAKILAGRGKVALRIGLPCHVFRPVTIDAPLSNQITVINAAFNAADNNYLKPSLYGKPVWFGDFDGRLTQAGDYLVRKQDGAIYFIAAQQPLLPLICVDCSRKLKVSRASEAPAEGALPYSGLSSPSVLPDILGTTDHPWPASILMGGRVQSSTGLPAGVREAAWSVLLPPSVPVTILSGDILTDDLGRRFTVESAELSDLGWRMMAAEVHS
ncbi:MAG: hypothetical protein JWO52_4046 [Gammaproteobacteria bacterium]|nr:hypothetical protein [Gammaproteobacteria bacterium]